MPLRPFAFSGQASARYGYPSVFLHVFPAYFGQILTKDPADEVALRSSCQLVLIPRSFPRRAVLGIHCVDERMHNDTILKHPLACALAVACRSSPGIDKWQCNMSLIYWYKNFGLATGVLTHFPRCGCNEIGGCIISATRSSKREARFKAGVPSEQSLLSIQAILG